MGTQTNKQVVTIVYIWLAWCGAVSVIFVFPSFLYSPVSCRLLVNFNLILPKICCCFAFTVVVFYIIIGFFVALYIVHACD